MSVGRTACVRIFQPEFSGSPFLQHEAFLPVGKGVEDMEAAWGLVISTAVCNLTVPKLPFDMNQTRSSSAFFPAQQRLGMGKGAGSRLP